MRIPLLLAAFALATLQSVASARVDFLLEKGWKFARTDDDASCVQYNDSGWESVTVPHDWAIYGPFDRQNDLQFMAIKQDGQKKAQDHVGRTGALPFVGSGWYRLTLDSIPSMSDGRKATLTFDGAMSHARVFVNGKQIAYQPYGYAPFQADITSCVSPGKPVTIAVGLENKGESSRWYPGAGLYRNIHLTVTDKVRIPVWGTYITTPKVDSLSATVHIVTELDYPESASNVTLRTSLYDPAGLMVAEEETPAATPGKVEQDITVARPKLWSTDTPALYRAVSRVYADGIATDETATTFGVRSIEIIPGEGFFMNGSKVIFKGVCNHHDLGALGTAVNEAALRYRIRLLKDMGCNAIRTSHNFPSPELVRLCDEMGMMVMAESFDEWKKPKMKNGYHLEFDEWAEKDVAAAVACLRNSPSIVFWSIGNEIPEQTAANGHEVAAFLQGLFHKYDPTRPCTIGMNSPRAFTNNFAAVMDVPGVNYMSGRYRKLYEESCPQGVLLGAETVSSFSSRGVYRLPVQRKRMARYDDHQSSSYDVEHTNWSDLPEDNFIQYESLPYDMGEFVWTGFDYLGEPTPYYNDWPSHSSVFGIIDLAGIPKDRYYLYRSFWNPDVETLHILPHWNWTGRENDTVPVFVYTNYPTVELFINGKSQGKRSKDMTVTLGNSANRESSQSLKRQSRYRLMWMDTRYEPGTVKAVAYDSDGRRVAEREIHTAGTPHHLELISDRSEIKADGKDLCFITVKMSDKDGNLCPLAQDMVNFRVSGSGVYRAGANGDPTCIDQFHLPMMHLFNGMLQIIVQSNEKGGNIKVEAYAPGIQQGTLTIKSVNKPEFD